TLHIMPAGYPNSVTVSERAHVGYSLTQRGNSGSYFVYFRDPNGKRLERDTKQTSKQRATDAARAIITAEYAPSADVEAVTWEEAQRRLREKAAADGLRDATIQYYEKLIRLIRARFAKAAGPADLSPAMADNWKKTFSTTETRRKKLPSPHTVFSLIRGFRSLWETWFVEQLGICAENPWADVTPPKTDKPEVNVIDDKTFADFLSWIDKKYSG